MDSLRSLASPSAQVIRGGKSMAVPSPQVVVGDIVELKTGESDEFDSQEAPYEIRQNLS